ncbi:GNAT family N-acetyltransferase [Candidatus Saccharibacteria bacterium]|nr:GNAT family N-acetyltransferase [Candidatus Saccharibacteria bacterium]
MSGYSFREFSFRYSACADDLTDEEARYIYLYDASRNNYGEVGTSIDENDINHVIDSIEANISYAVYDDDDEMVGVAAVEPLSGHLWLEGVAVDPSRRSSGIGAFILNSLKRVAVENECEKISGYSQPNSSTVSFYLRNNGYRDDNLPNPDSRYIPISIDVEAES